MNKRVWILLAVAVVLAIIVLPARQWLAPGDGTVDITPAPPEEMEMRQLDMSPPAQESTETDSDEPAEEESEADPEDDTTGE